MSDKKFEILIEVVTQQAEKVDKLTGSIEKLVAATAARGAGADKQVKQETQLARLKEMQADHERDMADLQRRTLSGKKQQAALEKEIARQKQLAKAAEGNPEKVMAARRRQYALEKELFGVQQKQTSQLNMMIGQAIMLAAAWKVVQAGTAFIGKGFNFNRTVEDSRLGIAAILAQFDDYGDYEDFSDAIEVAGEALEMLKQKASESPASLVELIGAFQATAGAAKQANLSLQQHIDLVTIMSQALAALGIRSDQIIQESRALLTGNITEDAMAARILGITKSQIDSARDAGQLFEFLTGKLQGFQRASEYAQNSMTVLLSNLGDEFDQLAGVTLESIFGDTKAVITDLKDIVHWLRVMREGMMPDEQVMHDQRQAILEWQKQVLNMTRKTPLIWSHRANGWWVYRRIVCRVFKLMLPGWKKL